MKEEKLQSKVSLVEEIKGKIEDSQSLVLMNYRGLNVAEVTELRAKFREAGVDYKVYKNTMMRRAFKDAGIEGHDDILTGPTAVAFGMEDLAAPARISADFAKDHEALELKAGFVDGQILDVKGVEQLAKLPSKEVLVAQFLGGMNGPIQGLANVMHGTMKGMAVVLNAIAEKKGQETA